MPHIINDEEYRLFQEYKKTGLTPAQIQAMWFDQDEDLAPMPMTVDEGNHQSDMDDFWGNV